MSSSPESAQSTGRKSPAKTHSLILPFVIVMAVLIISSANETASMHRQNQSIISQNQQTIDVLSRSHAQVVALKALQDDLEKLSPTDPVAAKIVAEYFSAAGSPVKNSATP